MVGELLTKARTVGHQIARQVWVVLAGLTGSWAQERSCLFLS